MAYLTGDATQAERASILGAAHAPAMLDIEVTQALRGLLRAHAVKLAVAERCLSELEALVVRRHPHARALLRRAWDLRDICSAYDGLYVALAEALDAPLVTRDQRLGRGVAHLVEVITP